MQICPSTKLIFISIVQHKIKEVYLFFIYVAQSLKIGLRILTEGDYHADNFKLGMGLQYADRGQGHS
jgi:hypothetical protein